jgi:hypothetical protein
MNIKFYSTSFILLLFSLFLSVEQKQVYSFSDLSTVENNYSVQATGNNLFQSGMAYYRDSQVKKAIIAWEQAVKKLAKLAEMTK